MSFFPGLEQSLVQPPPVVPSPSQSPSTLSNSLSKSRPDRWTSNPTQVTSFLTIPPSQSRSSRSRPKPNPTKLYYSSPICGFGWAFDFKKHFSYHLSDTKDVQTLVGQIEITFQPRSCKGMELGNISFIVQACFPDDNKKLEASYEKEFSNLSLETQPLGSYEEPFRYKGQATFEITLTFNANDQLSFPTTPSPQLDRALINSLEGEPLIDSKFYLYSAKNRGKPRRPKAVYGNADLLSHASDYLHDLVLNSNFQSGVSCNLYEDVPQVIDKLQVSLYDYDSDSDLESLPDEEQNEVPSARPDETSSTPKIDATPPSDASPPETPTSLNDPVPASEAVESLVPKELQENSEKQTKTPHTSLTGKAFAINGTAYQTWKSFLYYLCTNQIEFEGLKSGPFSLLVAPISWKKSKIACSPKSMYRLADYAGLPDLKDLAKQAIKKNLTQKNIVQELFCSFTSKYRDMIELEVDFLVKNFTPPVAQDFDDALQSIVLGMKPYSHQVLAFTVRRLRGESANDAWKAIDRTHRNSPSPPAPSSLPKVSPFAGIKF